MLNCLNIQPMESKLKIKLKSNVSMPLPIPIDTKLQEISPDTKLQQELPLKWQQHESVVYHLNKESESKSLAMFDLDGTIITTISGSKFATSSSDWKYTYDIVPHKLLKLHQEGYRLIIVSNQAGISEGHVSIEQLKDKLQQIYISLKLPISIYLCTKKDNFRKPMKALWQLILSHCQLTQLDVNPLSFYCGDAAGRAKGYLPGKPKDFNSTDRYFAYNIDLLFYTPEELFLGMSQFPYNSPYNTDLKLINYIAGDNIIDNDIFKDNKKKLIIMLGAPASGKSTLSKLITSISPFVLLNNDTIKNAKKLMTLFSASINAGKNIIIDNTNPKKATRRTYIDIAKAADYEVILYYFDYPKILSMHLNQMRLCLGLNKQSVPTIAIHKYYKDLEKPTMEEGFSQIIHLTKLPITPPPCYYYHYDLTR